MNAARIKKWRIHWIGDCKYPVEGAKSTRLISPLRSRTRCATSRFEQGTVSGCFDMSVDQDGRWWFLEVNQSGQFLWIDGLDPSARLYQRMLAFLAAREETHPKTAEEFPSYAECQSRFTFAREPQPLDRLEVMSVEGVL